VIIVIEVQTQFIPDSEFYKDGIEDHQLDRMRIIANRQSIARKKKLEMELKERLERERASRVEGKLY